MAAAITLEEIINFLLAAPMFGDLDPSELAEVVHIMQIQRMREGQVVFREGDPGDGWYVIFDGTVEVVKETEIGSRSVAKLGSPACFGEMAVLDGSQRSATVRTLSSVTAFRFPRLDFQGLIDDNNLAAFKLVYQMALVLAARQRKTTNKVSKMLMVDGDVDYREGLNPILDEASLAE
jgi:CRP/FNR family cyclic AMP-dependent transcriptional regulator